MCRTFHSVGFCPYGPRCHFIHNMEEAAVPIPEKKPVESRQNVSKPIGSGRILPNNNKVDPELATQKTIKPLPMFDNSFANGWNPLNSNSLFQGQEDDSNKPRLPVFSTFSK